MQLRRDGRQRRQVVPPKKRKGRNLTVDRDDNEARGDVLPLQILEVLRQKARPAALWGITSVLVPTSFPLRSKTSIVALACAALGLTSAITVNHVPLDATCAKTAS